MSSGRDREAATPRQGLPAFDPNPSAEFARALLRAEEIPFALIGRVAMWTLLPEDQHEFTKDVDFAVPRRCREPLRAALIRKGLAPRDLPIGGLAVRTDQLRIDFIDRSEGGLDRLFEEAIHEAATRGGQAPIGGHEVPVVSPEHLVAMKVVAAERRDQGDAVRLLKALPDLDLRRARAIVATHGGPGSANLLDTLAREAGRPDARPEYRNGG